MEKLLFSKQVKLPAIMGTNPRLEERAFRCSCGERFTAKRNELRSVLRLPNAEFNQQSKSLIDKMIVHEGLTCFVTIDNEEYEFYDVYGWRQSNENIIEYRFYKQNGEWYNRNHKCPKCGNTSWDYPGTHKVSEMAFLKDGKISISILSMRMDVGFSESKTWIFMPETLSQRWCINTKTGQTYSLPDWLNKKPVTGIRNISTSSSTMYPGGQFPSRELLEKVAEEIKPDLKCCNQLYLQHLTIANRYPQLNAEQVNTLATRGYDYHGKDNQDKTLLDIFKDTFKGIKNTSTSSEMFKMVDKNTKRTTTKWMRKLMANNFEAFLLLEYLPFKNADVARTVTSDRCLYNYVMSRECEMFVTELINAKGEAGASKALIQALSMDIVKPWNGLQEDMAEFIPENGECMMRRVAELYQLLKNPAKVELEKEIPLKGSIYEIYQNLLEIKEQLNVPSDIFPYPKGLKHWEMEIEGYMFRFARTERELKTIGADMRNCVGGYGNYCKNRAGYIIYASKDGSYKLCIEVRNDYTLMQCKAFANARPEGELREVALQWLSRCPEIKYSNCWDLQEEAPTLFELDDEVPFN